MWFLCVYLCLGSQETNLKSPFTDENQLKSLGVICKRDAFHLCENNMSADKQKISRFSRADRGTTSSMKTVFLCRGKALTIEDGICS